MEFDKLIQQRRSVRAYKPGQTITNEAIRELITATLQAPTWKNSETGRYYVANTPEAFEAVKAGLAPFNQKSCANASALIVTTYIKGVSGHTAGVPDNELGDKWGTYDLGLQNAYLVLKASDMGLDTLIMGIRDGEALHKTVGASDDEEVVAVIAVGTREGEPVLRRRKEAEDVVNFL